MATKTFDYADLSTRVADALQSVFPNAAIETEEGYLGRVHVKIVSPALNGQSEKAKQEMVWKALERALGPDAQGVSLVLPYGLDELP